MNLPKKGEIVLVKGDTHTGYGLGRYNYEDKYWEVTSMWQLFYTTDDGITHWKRIDKSGWIKT